MTDNYLQTEMISEFINYLTFITQPLMEKVKRYLIKIIKELYIIEKVKEKFFLSEIRRSRITF